MAKFTYISARGDTLSLSEDKDFRLVNIDGQTYSNASIASVVNGGMDGDVVNNVQVDARTITLDLRILDNVELTKRRILNVIKIKQQATLRWEQESRTLEIKGIVEEITMPRWTQATMMQISMHCSEPYWEDIDEIISRIREFNPLHYFTDSAFDMLYFPAEGIVFGEYDTTRTKSFHNEGDVDVGLKIEIIALDNVTNPIIYDRDGNYFGCGYGTGNKQVVMQAGDVIVINTRRNEKSVKLNGASILNKIKPNSKWLQLFAGDNTFAINSDDESISNMSFLLTYKQRYI